MVKKCFLCRSLSHLFAGCALFHGLQQELAANVGIRHVPNGDVFCWVDRFGHSAADLSELVSLDWLLAENVKFWSSRRIENLPPPIVAASPPVSSLPTPEVPAPKYGPLLDLTAEQPVHTTVDHFSLKSEAPSILSPDFSSPVLSGDLSPPEPTFSQIRKPEPGPVPLDLDSRSPSSRETAGRYVPCDESESSLEVLDTLTRESIISVPEVHPSETVPVMKAAITFPGDNVFSAVLDPKSEFSVISKSLAQDLNSNKYTDVSVLYFPTDFGTFFDSDGKAMKISERCVSVPCKILTSGFGQKPQKLVCRFLVRNERVQKAVSLGANILKHLKYHKPWCS